MLLQAFDRGVLCLGFVAGLGDTAIHQLPPNPRSHLYDVYGQPRAAPPPLPRTYKEEQAEVALNTRHIAVEGDMLRAPGSHTSR
eukprot:scaffold284406_cov37-Tisochrysis_lutea.AAC.1